MDQRAYLPESLRQDPTTVAIADTIALQAARPRQLTEELFDQLSPLSATWGLPAWETLTDVHLPPEATLEERRRAVSTRLSSFGTVDAALISRLCTQICGHPCRVTERFGQYLLEIDFGSVIGRPAHLDEFAHRLRETLPAHLEYAFVFTWRSYAALRAYTRGYLMSKHYTYAQIRGGESL